jgi:hypothetical protein
MKSIAYKRPDLKKKNLNRLSMKNSNKLFNGQHIDDVMDNVTQRRLQEGFEDTKEVIRIRISKKNRHRNGQKKKYNPNGTSK